MTINTYNLLSVKGSKTVTGTLNDAIQAAQAMDAELQPAYGVDIWCDDVIVAAVDETVEIYNDD